MIALKVGWIEGLRQVLQYMLVAYPELVGQVTSYLGLAHQVIQPAQRSACQFLRSEHLLSLGSVVRRHTEQAVPRRQRQSLSNARHVDHDEGQKADQVARWKRGTSIRRLGQCQGGRQGDDAT